MVADQLAIMIVSKHVPAGSRVIDPFCGSGRLLVAAEGASLRVGLDVNPLAWLLTQAKLAPVRTSVVGDILAQISVAAEKSRKTKFNAPTEPSLALDIGRKVPWFAPETAHQLDCIVSWVNELGLHRSELLLVAAALSATVREVSFARQGGWKLHRLNEASRAALTACPWKRLERRLAYCLGDLRDRPAVYGDIHVELADACSLRNVHSSCSIKGPYDIVITSPPYGDSRTTVQYGAASSLCLFIVRKLCGLQHLFVDGPSIDNACLGGHAGKQRDSAGFFDLNQYWAGFPRDNVGSISRYFLNRLRPRV